MSTRRAALLAAAGGLAAWTVNQSFASSLALLRPLSLVAELQRAVTARKALVVMVSLDGCPYCKLVRESYLVHLKAGGQPIVQLELVGNIPLQDLRGRESTHAKVVSGFDVRIAPTVLFIGRGGAEAAPRLTGVASPDFYGAYLQERVEAANRSVGV